MSTSVAELSINIDAAPDQLLAGHHQHDQKLNVLPSGKKTSNLSLPAQLKAILTFSWLNILLVCVPLGIVSGVLQWNTTWVFAINFFAVIPLSAMLGWATEEVAEYTNGVLAALLNCTFGNFVEMVIGIICVNNGLISLAQASLLGSILSNLLLVVGTSFLAGGIKYHEQTFNVNLVRMASSLTGLSVLSLLIPAAYVASGNERDSEDLSDLSRGVSILLIVVYILFVYYQVGSHKSQFEEIVHVDPGSTSVDDDDQLTLTLPVAISLLGVSGIVVSICCEYLVDAIEGGSSSWGISDVFIGLILLPFIGNAVEHSSAVFLAYRNKMTAAVGIALGSSIQVALFITPLLVIVGWIFGQDMTLYFDLFQTTILFLSVLITNYVIGGGKSTWFFGVLCIVAYICVAISAWYCE